MSPSHILLIVMAEVLVFAVAAAIAFHRAQQDARTQTAETIDLARSYAERVAGFVTRRPELSRDPEVREALLPTPAETLAFGYRAPVPPPAPIPPRRDGAPSLPDCSPGLAAFLEEHLNAVASRREEE
jgi:hypothetical protein